MADLIQQYQILSRIANGATGTVYRGRNTETNATVAMKALHTEFTRDARTRSRLLDSARTLRGLKGEHIAQLLDILEKDGNVFMVMEYAAGKPLSSLLGGRGRALSPEIAVPMIAQTLRAVAQASSKNVEHGGLKPNDILLGEGNRVKVEGFGIAKCLGSTALLKAASRSGALPYTAPEIIKGAEPTAASDVYSAGAMLYHLLSGTAPFAEGMKTDMQLRQAIVYQTLPEPPIFENLPSALTELVRRSLSKQRSERPTARDMARTLNGLYPQPDTSAPSPQTLVGMPPQPIRVSTLSTPSAPPSAGSQAGSVATAALINQRMRDLKARQEEAMREDARKEREAASSTPLPKPVVPSSSSSASPAAAQFGGVQQSLPSSPAANPQQPHTLASSSQPSGQQVPAPSGSGLAFTMRSASTQTPPAMARDQAAQPQEKKKRRGGWIIIGALLAGGTALYVAYRTMPSWFGKQSAERTASESAADSIERRLKFIDSVRQLPEVRADWRDTVEPGSKLWDSLTKAEQQAKQTGQGSSQQSVGSQDAGQGVGSQDAASQGAASQSLANPDNQGAQGSASASPASPTTTTGKLPAVLMGQGGASNKSASGTKESDALAAIKEAAKAKPQGSSNIAQENPKTAAKPSVQPSVQPSTPKTQQQQSVQQAPSAASPKAPLPNNVSQQREQAKQAPQAAPSARVTATSTAPAARTSPRAAREQQREEREQREQRRAAERERQREQQRERMRERRETALAARASSAARKQAEATSAETSSASSSASSSVSPSASSSASSSRARKTSKQADGTRTSIAERTPQDMEMGIMERDGTKTILRGHLGAVQSVSFSPDGKLLVSGGADKTVKIWDVANGKILRSMRGHDKSVTSVFFSPDGKYVMSGSADKTVKVWNVDTGEKLQSTEGISCSGSPAAFSPDGKLVATTKNRAIILSKIK